MAANQSSKKDQEGAKGTGAKNNKPENGTTKPGKASPAATKADMDRLTREMGNLGDRIVGAISNLNAPQTPPAPATPPEQPRIRHNLRQAPPAAPQTPPAPATPPAEPPTNPPTPPAAPQTPPAPATPPAPPAVKLPIWAMVLGILSLVAMTAGMFMLLSGSAVSGLGLLVTGAGLGFMSAYSFAGKKWSLVVSLILFAIGLILVVVSLMTVLKPVAELPGATTPPAATATTEASAPAESAAASQSPTTTAALIEIANGIDQPSKSWFLAKAGSLISGDVAIFDGDNNSRKIPVYDSEENTADVIVLAEDVYIWAEWGCYYVEQPNQTTIDFIINSKVADGYEVRYFANFTKLGDHAFTTTN